METKATRRTTTTKKDGMNLNKINGLLNRNNETINHGIRQFGLIRCSVR